VRLSPRPSGRAASQSAYSACSPATRDRFTQRGAAAAGDLISPVGWPGRWGHEQRRLRRVLARWRAWRSALLSACSPSGLRLWAWPVLRDVTQYNGARGGRACTRSHAGESSAAFRGDVMRRRAACVGSRPSTRSVRVVQDPIEDGVGQSRIADDSRTIARSAVGW